MMASACREGVSNPGWALVTASESMMECRELDIAHYQHVFFSYSALLLSAAQETLSDLFLII